MNILGKNKKWAERAKRLEHPSLLSFFELGTLGRLSIAFPQRRSGLLGLKFFIPISKCKVTACMVKGMQCDFALGR